MELQKLVTRGAPTETTRSQSSQDALLVAAAERHGYDGFDQKQSA